MYKLIILFKRVYVPLLFVLLEILAIQYYSRSTSYTKAKLLTTSNAVVGGIQKVFRNVGDYFSLKSENRLLISKITALENRLAEFQNAPDVIDLSESGEIQPYYFTSAKVLNNSIARQENFIILDKGSRDGVEADMAVLSMEGMVVGYVIESRENFSVCMSLLNRDFNMGGKIKNKDFFGSLSWDGRNHQYATLTEIPRYAAIEKGDSIMSTISFRFPPDSFIGTIEDFTLSDDQTNYTVKVKLATRFATLRNVMVVKYNNAEEMKSLEQQQENR